MASWLSPSGSFVKAVLPVPLPTPTPAVVLPRRAAPPAVLSVGGKARRGAVLVAAAGAVDEYHKYADLRSYLESHKIVTSNKMSPTAKLMDVMSRPVQVATPGQQLAEIDAFFAAQSGLPVVDDEGRCIGVISNKDKTKASYGMESTVGEVMSSPAISLTHQKTVLEAAALMLKEKVHRIPVVNEQQHVIGIITRTDVFQAFEANEA